MVQEQRGHPTQFVPACQRYGASTPHARCYMPFDEAFVDEHSTRPGMPYKFNGKEQDQETGLYYYGARYYEPKICVWYGVDAMAEKGRSWSPYCYTINNPMRFVDPDGNWPWENINIKAARNAAKKTGGTFLKWKGADGYMHASVQVGGVKQGEATVTCKVFKGTRINDSSGFANIMNGFSASIRGNSKDPYEGKEGFKKLGNDLLKGSTYIKGAGIIATAAGPEVGGPIYILGQMMDRASSVVKIISAVDEGDTKNAVIEVGSAVAGEALGASSNLIKDEVRKLGVIAIGDAMINKTKKELNNNKEKE